MRIYTENEVLPIGFEIKSRVDHFGTTIREYKISEIYRTYNTARKMVMLRYDLSCRLVERKMYGIKHDDLKRHILCEKKEKQKTNI